MVQPGAGWHTVTPVPRSTHSREQQLDAPEQGVPPCPQPPDGVMQRPGAVPGATPGPALPLEQSPEQQSWSR